jgi:hypothetical protein
MAMGARGIVVAGMALLAALGAGAARADTPGDEQASYATFALIIGVNQSVDPDTTTLRYADDDAARYLDLFRSLGARTYVLTRLDENTSRLHPQLAAEALLPLRADFDRAVASVAHDVAQARQRHVKTALYFVYAGHGNVSDGRGYITLEDSRLDAATLDGEVVDGVGADHTHFIVDACDSYFLALGRGPGGQRREAHGFSTLGGLRVRDSVGLLLSTSSARESHEWSGYQAGVFSHEVRSALYGAADADGDGQVSYREVSAFVERANEAIPNEQYRPDVYARAPKDSPVLLDLRGRRSSRIDVSGSHAGRYFLEDSRGVRIADFHNEAGQAAYLLRPAHVGRLYLRRADDEVEFAVPAGPSVVEVAELSPSEPRERARGGANDAYELLFALPFGEHVVRDFSFDPLAADALPSSSRPVIPVWRLAAGVGFEGLAVAGGVLGAMSWKSALDVRAGAMASSQKDVSAANTRIRERNTATAIELGCAGAAAVTGALLLLWPQAAEHVDVRAAARSAMVEVRGAL